MVAPIVVVARALRRSVRGFRALDAWRQIAVAGTVGMPVVGVSGQIFTVRAVALPLAGIGVLFAGSLAVRSEWQESPASFDELVGELSGLKLFTAASSLAVGTGLLVSYGLDVRFPLVDVYTLGIPFAGLFVLVRHLGDEFTAATKRCLYGLIGLAEATTRLARKLRSRVSRRFGGEE